jgi:NAD(P)-dependent dehydrogenase (short-subunit alcohol dehydrogenase family)
MELAKKVILVGGVGTGLGTAVVSTLAADGATVIGIARTSRALEPIQAHARRRGWKFSAHTADLLNQADVDRTVRSALDEFGHLDGVSINVGHWVGGETLLHRMSEGEWNAGVRDNTEPVYRVARATLPHLIERGSGSMVLVSAAPSVRWAGSASYALAKGGLAELVPKLARDYRPFGVRINAVLPGSMSSRVDSMDPPAADGPVRLTETTPTSPWEVARAIRYLLSDESHWVTGSLVVVDGGSSTGGAEPGSEAP